MKRYRLVTKADFDGMACGVLCKELDLIDGVAFAHPDEVDDGSFEITDGDITAGLPYREQAHIAFDHAPFASRSAGSADHWKVAFDAPSTARVIYNHYGKDRFADIHEDLLDAVDKGLNRNLTTEDILYPTGWVLLNYLIDHRTGLDRFKRFSRSHDEFMDELMAEGRDHSIWEILGLPDVEERLDLYFSCVEEYKAQILRCSSVYSNLLVTDTREEKLIYPGNRFMPYALFPECNVSLYVSSVEEDGRTVLAAGRSVLDRSCSLDIGHVMKKYGGGGYHGAGACHVADGRAEEVLEGLIGDLQYGFFTNLYMGYFNYY
ncbi:MAG: exopolyphosphatase [Elusimicrobia bacterium]|nr:exopolyphosphatase [Elusimicrobiota bacterium]